MATDIFDCIGAVLKPVCHCRLKKSYGLFLYPMVWFNFKNNRFFAPSPPPAQKVNASNHDCQAAGFISRLLWFFNR